MIKKIVFTIFIGAFILSPIVIDPLTVTAAKANTLAELRKDLAALQAKKAAADKKKNQTQSEINGTKSAIKSAKNTIETNKQKTEDAKIKVEDSKQAINNKQEDMKNVVAAYQMQSGDNEYLEFIFNADSITDLIYRYSVSEQLMEWQKEEIDKYESLIQENEKLQVDLANKEIELNTSIDNWVNKMDDLGDKLSEYSEVSLSIDDEIKSAKEYIKAVEKAGCGENEDIDVCLGLITDTGFKRPLVNGRVTSGYGPRKVDVSSADYHYALDIGGNKEGTNVYAAAAGTVGKVIVRATCGGNSVYIWHTVNGKKYTTQYTHLKEIKVKSTQVVTSSTVIGTVGGSTTAAKNGGYDSCTNGAHLHFAMAEGHYGGSGSNSYTTYSKYISNTFDPAKTMRLSKTGRAAVGLTWSSR